MKLRLKKAIISAGVVLAGVNLLLPTASVLAAPQNQTQQTQTTTQSTTSTTTSTDSTSTNSKSSDLDTATENKITTARCEGGVLGWIFCPVIKMGQEFVAQMEKLIIQQLQTGPLQRDGRYQNLYNAWASFRDLANVFFIGIFLAIIFAQTLGFGLDNYSIKMMLPRLIIAAIAIQFSFFIMQLGIDISNVAGNGIASLLTSVITTGSSGGAAYTTGQAFIALSLVGGVGAFAAGTVILSGLIVPALLLLLAGALAMIGVLVTVWLRVIVLQLLVLLAPLALVAWVLPNTQKWFKLWSSNVIKLLLMYPIIAFMISAGALATHITAVTAENGNFAKMLASLVPIMVFFLIPTAIKASGSLMAFTSGLVMDNMTKMSKTVRKSQLMADARQDLKERAYREYADNDLKAAGVNTFGKKGKRVARRGMARMATGNAFAFQSIGDAGRRKMTTGVAHARHALEDDWKTFFSDNAFSNPELMRIAQAGLIDHAKEYDAENTYGTKYKLKMNHHLAEAAVSQMIQQQGMVELSELLDGPKNDDGTLRDAGRGLFDHQTNQWKSKEIQQTMLRAMGPNAGAVLNKITHAVHLQGDIAYGELSGNNFAALGAGSGITAATEAVRWNRVNALNSMIQVINSNSLAGSIQNDVAKSLKRELQKADAANGFSGVTIQAQGRTYTSVTDFLNTFISAEGQVQAVQGDIKRTGYDPILSQIKTEQAILKAEIARAREDFKERGGTPDLHH